MIDTTPSAVQAIIDAEYLRHHQAAEREADLLATLAVEEAREAAAASVIRLMRRRFAGPASRAAERQAEGQPADRYEV
jgi:hypothetical protein